jgi:[ribosomal protein S5]-alanine N-acetyltransferase
VISPNENIGDWGRSPHNGSLPITRKQNGGIQLEIIETERLQIRRFSKSDAADLYEYLSDGEVVKFEPYEVFTLEECVREAAERSLNPGYWAVCLKDGGKLIGNLWLNKTNQRFATWELGYVFNSNYQGMGYASEACRAMITYAFEDLHAHRIIAKCDVRNAPSWKLLERLHFRREAHKLQNVYFHCDEKENPVWKDTFEYAMLAEEWRP